ETPAIGAAPAICATQGECKGAVAACPCANTADTGCTGGGSCTTTCASTSGWQCNYPATVNVDVNGNIVAETKCDNLDNDCDGVVDEGSSSGSLTGESWVEIGGGHQMMKFEASRPDATTNNAVSVSTCTNETITAAGATEAGTTATFTTNVAHGLAVGDRVT